MKPFLLFLFLLLLSVSSSGQIVSVHYDHFGKRACVAYQEGDTIYKAIVSENISGQRIPGLPGNVIAFPSSQSPETDAANATNELLFAFDPGTYPEGDMLHDIEFTADGRLFGIVYQYGNVVYFYDSAYNMLSIVPVDDEPIDMCIVNNKAYVVCKGSNSVNVIDLNNFNIEDTFPVYDNACQIAVSPDETIAYVGFSSFEDGSIGAYNLQTHTQIYHLWDPFITQIGWKGYGGRVFSQFFPFMLSPDGNYLICGDDEGAFPLLYNAPQGTLLQRFEFESMKGAKFSDDSGLLFVLTSSGITGRCGLRKVSLPDLAVTDSIIFESQYFFGITNLVLSNDQQKILAVNESDDKVYYFDILAHTLTEKPETGFFGLMLKGSFDKQFGVISTTGRYVVYNVNTGNKVSNNNASIGSGVGFTLSPVNGQMIYSDDCFFNWFNYSGERYGRALLNPAGTITYTEVLTSGEDPEADSPTSSALCMDGSHLITCNRLSKNITVYNMASGEADTTFSLGKITNVYRIPGTDKFVFFGYDDITVSIYDHSTGLITAQFIIGSCTQAIASPMGDYLYVYGDAPPTGRLYKISLTASPPVISEILSVPYIPYEFTVLIFGEPSNTHYSKLEISPDGRYIIFPINHFTGNYIYVADVYKMEIVKTFSGISTSVLDYAFTENSQKACLVTYDRNLIIMNLNGTDTDIEVTKLLPQIGMSVVYHPFEELFYVLYIRDQILKVDPIDGSNVGEIWTTNNVSWDLYLDNGNVRLVCQNMSIWKDGLTYALPNASISSSFDSHWNALLVNIPGPDRVYVLGDLFLDSDQTVAPEKVLKCYPNPSSESVTIELSGNGTMLELIDNQGRVVERVITKSGTYSMDVRHMSNGLYLVKSYQDDRIVTGRILVSH
jgi:DNA-binding beta-propeller fold protein YncE